MHDAERLLVEGRGIVRRSEDLLFRRARKQIDELKKQREPLKSARRADAPHKIGAAPRRVAEELEAPQGVAQERLKIGKLGKDIRPRAQQFGGELNHHVPPFDHLAGLEIADPVMRQIGAREHEIAGAELADMVADELAPVRAGDEVNFIFGMIVPARDVAWTIVLMPFERLRRIGDDGFEIRRPARASSPRHVSSPYCPRASERPVSLSKTWRLSSENVIRT